MDVSLIAHVNQYRIRGENRLSTFGNLVKIGYIFASRHWQLSHESEGLEKFNHRLIAAIHFIPVLNYISSFIEYVVMNKCFGEHLYSSAVKNPFFKNGKLYFKDGSIKDVKEPNLFAITGLSSKDAALHRSALYANLTTGSHTYENAYKYLLDRKANILSKDTYGNTPLHRAAGTPSFDFNFFKLVATDTFKAQKTVGNTEFLRFDVNNQGQTALDLLFQKVSSYRQPNELINCLEKLVQEKVINPSDLENIRSNFLNQGDLRAVSSITQ